MTNVEQLESQIKGLTADELEAFRDWFAKFDADAWDQQIEGDSKRSVLDSIANLALAEYNAGRSTIL
jgi:hypothetical protein